jgi:hypothetical protein
MTQHTLPDNIQHQNATKKTWIKPELHILTDEINAGTHFSGFYEGNFDPKLSAGQYYYFHS